MENQGTPLDEGKIVLYEYEYCSGLQTNIKYCVWAYESMHVIYIKINIQTLFLKG